MMGYAIDSETREEYEVSPGTPMCEWEEDCAREAMWERFYTVDAAWFPCCDEHVEDAPGFRLREMR